MDLFWFVLLLAVVTLVAPEMTIGIFRTIRFFLTRQIHWIKAAYWQDPQAVIRSALLVTMILAAFMTICIIFSCRL
jgi:hypothetical protein